MGREADHPNKLKLTTSKLNVEDLDKLVVETSHFICERGLDEFLEPNTNPLPSIASLSLERIHTDKYNKLNQPKRPMNAFMVWGQAVRRELHHRFSNVQNALLSKSLGRVWRSLEMLEKEPFIKRANLIKASHKRAYPDYKYQPRRIQDRRGKSNMLIGIHLNHPVSQISTHTCQTSYGIDPCQTDFYKAHAPLDAQQNYDQHKTMPADTKVGHQGFLPDFNLNNVQTYEYHPYTPNSMHAKQGDDLTNRRSLRTDTAFRAKHLTDGGSTYIYYNQQTIYPPYQQSTANFLQQSQQQTMTGVQTSYGNDYVNNNVGHFYGTG